MRHQITRSIRELDEAQWDVIAGDEISMTHRWQRVMEAGWRDHRSRYLLLTDDRGPLAIAVAGSGRAFGYTGWPGRLIKRFALVLTAPLSSLNCGVMLRPGAEMAAVLPQLDRALGRICWRERRVLLAVINVPPGDVAVWRAMRFLSLPGERAAVLDLPPDYEQYVQTLAGEKRSRLRRIRRRGAAREVTFAHGPPAGDGERIYPLFCEVFSRHGTPLTDMPFTAEFFSILEREMPGEVQLFRGFVGGELAGVSLGISAGKTLWWGPVIGLRYDLARPSYLYFLLIDEIIRWSIARGFRQIQGGLTGAREKQEQGFRLQERWICCRAHPPLLNVALRVAASLTRRAMPERDASATF